MKYNFQKKIASPVIFITGKKLHLLAVSALLNVISHCI